MKKSTWKKCFAMVLCLAMLLMTACSNQTQGEGGTEAPAGKTEAPAGNQTEAPAGNQTEAPEVVYPDKVLEPITIEFWHVCGSGTMGDYINAKIEAFNASNEYGITVEGIYQGNYYETLSKITAGSIAGEIPAMAIVGAGGIETLFDGGLLTDMMPYMERDNFDIENIPEGLRYFMCHEEGQALVIPYTVSSAVLYYNKDLWTEVPTTIQELYAGAKKIYEETGVPGWGLTGDVGYVCRPVLTTLGAFGLVTEDGLSADCLENGAMLTYLTDWQNGIKEGYVVPPAVTDAGNAMNQLFYSGKLGMFGSSSGSLKSVMQLSAENGINLGIAPYVGYDAYCAPIGGGSLAILGSTQQEQAAAWEFMKFLVSDENLAELHTATGYLPATYSAAETETCQNFWKEYPGFKVAFDQLAYAKPSVWSIYGAEWRSKVTEAVQYVIITQEWTPQEAVDFLKTQVSVVFP